MIEQVPVQAIWLEREGGENDPLAKVVVYVQMDGIWYEAIRELASSQFSHCITATGLTSEECRSRRPAWLNRATATREEGNKP